MKTIKQYASALLVTGAALCAPPLVYADAITFDFGSANNSNLNQSKTGTFNFTIASGYTGDKFAAQIGSSYTYSLDNKGRPTTSLASGFNISNFGLYSLNSDKRTYTLVTTTNGIDSRTNPTSAVSFSDTANLSLSSLVAGTYQLRLEGKGTTNSIATKTFGYTATPIVSSVPEPESYAMFLAGISVLAFIVRRRSSLKQADQDISLNSQGPAFA
jgi:hypothetical protein